MQKKKILIYSLIIVSVLSIFLLSKYIRKEPSSLDEVRLKDTVINKNNNLAIMLETEADSGEYEEADSIVFPKSQYKFNAELSGCLDMNGLKIDNVLTYKDGMAYVEVGSSAYCYLYFNLPPKCVNYLLNEKTRTTSLWTSTLDGDGYRFVGGSSETTYCAYDIAPNDSIADPSDSCPEVYKNSYYDESLEDWSDYYDSSCDEDADQCTKAVNVGKILSEHSLHQVFAFVLTIKEILFTILFLRITFSYSPLNIASPIPFKLKKATYSPLIATESRFSK